MNRIEQRECPRWRRVSEHEITHVRLRPGREVILLDVSAAGALIEAHGRLQPGSIVELQMTRADRAVTVRGRVVRAAVSRLYAEDIWYRAAVAFDRRLAWLAAETAGLWGRTTQSAGYAPADQEPDASEWAVLLES
jgi:hypothetical protein